MAKRDQLAEIALLMDKHFVHEHTDNSLTVECVESMLEGIQEAWQIINILHMAQMDEGEAWKRALDWLHNWENVSIK